MCDQCSGRMPEESADEGAKKGLSRRALLAMGTSAAAGIVLGLWYCQNHAAQTRPNLDTTTSGGASKPASTTRHHCRHDFPSLYNGIQPIGDCIADSKPRSTPQTAQANATTTRRGDGRSRLRRLSRCTWQGHRGRFPMRLVIIVPRTDWTLKARPDLGQH